MAIFIVKLRIDRGELTVKEIFSDEKNKNSIMPKCIRNVIKRVFG